MLKKITLIFTILFAVSVFFQPLSVQAASLDTDTIYVEASKLAQNVDDQELFDRALKGISDSIPIDRSNLKNKSVAIMRNDETGEVKNLETISTVKLLGEKRIDNKDTKFFVSASYTRADYDYSHGNTHWDESGGVRARTTVYFATTQDSNGINYAKMLWSDGSWVNHDYPQIRSITNRSHTFVEKGYQMNGDFFNRTSKKSISSLSFTRNAPSSWPYIFDGDCFEIGDGTDATIVDNQGNTWSLHHQNVLYSWPI